MAANYPTIVRKFQAHVDGTEYVMASHMNDAQDEIMAIESTLGVKPAVYTPTTGNTTQYPSVGNRLDVIQRRQAQLTELVEELVDASNYGWNLPIASIHAGGTSIAPTKDTKNVLPSDWKSMRWDRKMLDSHGMYAPGYYLTIPRNGWWILTSRIMMHTPAIPKNVEHALYGRMRVLSSENLGQVVNWDLAAADSASQGTTYAWHRLTLAAGWPFYAGDRVAIQLRHDYFPTESGQSTPSKSTLTAMCRVQLTYIRGLPEDLDRDDFQLDDEIGT